ncbi:heparanase-like isoform X2 [Liolophura sinensis]|uniref:heparanase-like isoform X2 n=1 Tax=Liolophura sinensis TaxID=3198878 RepID=UPI00315864CD
MMLSWRCDNAVHASCCLRVTLCLAVLLFFVIILTTLQNCFVIDAGTLSVSATVNKKRVLHVIDDRYASVGIDASLVQEKFKNFDTSSVKLLTLSQSLGPCYVRVGGTAEDLLVFDDKLLDKDSPFRKPQHVFVMTDWDKINKFVSDVGWHLVFGLNLLLRNGSSWDPSNAEALMKYSDQKGYQMHLELGNEPNSFKHVFQKTVDPSQSAKDFHVLRNLMQTFSTFKSSLLIGPDVTRPIKTSDEDELTTSSKDYLRRFLKTGSPYVDVVTFHHYYVRSQTATASDFRNPAILDSLQGQITLAQSIINSTSPGGKRLWLGEAGSSSGGGAPLLSNRYIAGFMWLDRLGLSAVSGVDVVIRQSFYKGNYAMIDCLDYTPFPDYWLTLLYKRLVGTRVLEVTRSSLDNHLRVYGHCTRTGDRSKYHAGAVTLYILNLWAVDVEVKLPQFSETDLHLYLLTPDGPSGLHSRNVRLNGQVLEMLSDSELPRLEPQTWPAGNPVHMEALTFGFVVIPDANVTVCM